MKPYIPSNLIQHFQLGMIAIQEKLMHIGLLDPQPNIGDPDGKPLVSGVYDAETIAAIQAFRELYDIPSSTNQADVITALMNTKEGIRPDYTVIDATDSADRRLAKQALLHMAWKRHYICRHPRGYNIVYIEGMNPDGTLNANALDQWNDLRLVIRIDAAGRTELVHKAVATTEPGRYYTDQPLNRHGAARIALGQYKAWRFGQHQRTQPALVQRGPIRVHRDGNRDGRRSPTDRIDVGVFGINQHSTRPGAPPPRINRWSAGCLVGQDYQQHLEFLEILKDDYRAKANKQYLFTTSVLAGDMM